jgi:5,10-methylene-tetrahydrofolate dehydrogenase/methenyl tetrahydrofolate cyclohydrolase
MKDAMDDNYFSLVKELLSGNPAEALEWLRGGSPTSRRSLGEKQKTEDSIAFVQQLYDLGAEQVLAVEINEYNRGQNTSQLLVQLPYDDEARARLFAFERNLVEPRGFDGMADEGQEYLYLELN